MDRAEDNHDCRGTEGSGSTEHRAPLHAVSSTDRDLAIRWHADRLRGMEALQLPQRRRVPRARTGNRGRIDFTLNDRSRHSTAQLAASGDTSVAVVLLTLWQVLLYRYTNATDLALALRTDAKLPDCSQPMEQARLVIFRHSIGESMSFSECVLSTTAACDRLDNHTSIPLSELATALELPADEATLPFSSYLFDASQRPDETAEESSTSDPSPAQYELCLHLPTDHAQSGRLALEFDADLFQRSDLEPMTEHLATLLDSARMDPEQHISNLKLMSDAEHDTVLNRFNDTLTEYPHKSSLTDLLAEQALLTPDLVAVSFEQDTLTYQALLDQVDRMATWLKRYSLRPDSLVGVCLPRTPQLLITFLAIQRAGAAYVPIDPAYPAERRQYVLDDASVQLFITSESLVGIHRPAGVPLVLLENEWQDIQSTEIEALTIDARQDDLAYVIYTSGSTGKPKGVQNTRRNLVNQLLAFKHQLGLNEKDSMLALSTVAFDISILELYLPLLCGARNHIVSRDVAIDGTRLSAVLNDEAITVFQATPATWRLLLEAGWQGDGRVMGLIGGEPLPRDLARILVPQLRSFWNLYGPTETTGFSTCDSITDPEALVTVGRPLANYQIYIRDPRGALCPINVPGEICVTGDGMSRGYLNRPELNQRVFPPDTVRNDGNRMYLTGDVGRWLPDGRIECLGRKDNQVKLRGYRIELGEIELALSTAEGVDHAVVILIKSDTEEYLAAYIVSKGQGSTPDAMCEHLKASLPAYMVPSSYTFMDSLPTSPSGKVDRHALPAPDRTVLHRKVDDPPRTETEVRIANLWQQLLDQPDIDRHDNFFDLGGHSLLAMRFISQVRLSFQIELSVQTLVTASLAQIADLISPCSTVDDTETKPSQTHSEPLYFDSGRHRLFGVLHTGLDNEGNKASGAPRGAILICQPLGHEYQRLQRAVRLLAAGLAEKGYDVLRFDYAGTGDSSGTLREISINDWKQNIVDATAFLLSRTQTDALSGIGIRMGAMLLANSAPKPLNHCVLWDPVFDGKHWIHTVGDMTHSAMRNLDRYRREQNNKDDAELFGYLYTADLLEELGRLSPDIYETLWTGNSLLLSSSETIHGQLSLETPIQKRLLKPTQVTVCDDRQRWSDAAVADDMVLAARSTQLITRWFR